MLALVPMATGQAAALRWANIGVFLQEVTSLERIVRLTKTLD